MTYWKKISFSKLFLFIPHIILFILIVSSLYYFFTRGFIPHDEGWILNPAQRIVQGDMPYKDFHYLYLPGVAYVIALAFKLFGISIFVSRIVSMIFSLITICCLFFISRQIMRGFYA